MPRIADYAIVSGGSVTMTKPGGDIDKEFEFSLASNAHLASRTIFGFIADPSNATNLKFRVLLNGSEIRSLELDGGHFRGTVHEVVAANLLKKGSGSANVNKVKFELTSGSGTLHVSDVVVWFQADV